jgi:hypothetical protein
VTESAFGSIAGGEGLTTALTPSEMVTSGFGALTEGTGGAAYQGALSSLLPTMQPIPETGFGTDLATLTPVTDPTPPASPDVSAITGGTPISQTLPSQALPYEEVQPPTNELRSLGGTVPGSDVEPPPSIGQAAYGAGTPPTTSGGILDTAQAALKGLGLTPAQGLGAAAMGGMMLKNMIMGPQQLDSYKVLQGEAAQANQLLKDFQAGKLPPGYKSAIDSATNAAIAKIKSQYASMGMAGSTPEMQAIQAAQQNALIMTAQIGEQLLQGGLKAVGMESSIYETLLKMDEQQSIATGNAIANFAASLAGGMRPLQSKAA